MLIEQIWGLQQLKKSLRGPEKEKFAQLENNLLDTFHRYRLYHDDEAFLKERDEILQQLDDLAQASVHKSFVALCKTRSASSSLVLNEPFFPTLMNFNQTDRSPQCPIADIELLTEFVPIAYCYQQAEEKYPLITLHFDNRHLSKTFIANAKVSFDGYSDPVDRSIIIHAGTQQEVPFLPLIRKEHMEGIIEQCRVTLRVEIHYLSPFSWQWSHSRTIHFLPRNAAILWKCEDDGSLVDYTPYLAAWVTPRHSIIEKLVNKASHFHPENALQGYNVSGTREEKSQKVRDQIKAIFDVLHNEVGITYISSSERIQPDLDTTMQKVQLIRLPAEVIKAGGSANCIDGTILFASLLERINLHPLIFIQPGHALVGWRVFKDDLVYEFLETTIINKGDFHLALRQGQEQYECACKRGVLGKTIINPHDYAFLIDIANCRRDNIQPMDW